jgi:hypothetical protein
MGGVVREYQTKIVKIKAFRLGFDEVPDWFDKDKVEVVIRDHEFDFIISTLEGKMKATHGDWIIKGLLGEVYPCKNEVFERKYELAFVEKEEPQDRSEGV